MSIRSVAQQEICQTPFKMIGKKKSAKRRLRALSRLVLPSYGREGWDYILIGKPTETCGRPFKLLVQDLQTAISNLHKKVE